MPELRLLHRAAAVAALVQLASLFVLGGIAAALGPRPETAEAWFAAFAEQGHLVVLRGDLVILALLIGPYLLTAPAVAMALRDERPGAAALFFVGSYLTVSGALATESTFSLLHLAEHAAAATSDQARAIWLAAGEAVVASDLWNSTAGFFGGLLLQGSGVVVSVAMLGSRRFSRVTAISGLLANGADLFQHLADPFAPGIADAIKLGMGLFYLVWFPALARDLWRLAGDEA